ncbi:MAG: DUF1302 domain-containing protein [Betaproteobacteria bacterium HGW-Betaproteobacteria-12]|nr:MAG: DUF1302 domain-containing protein [Betaproteobacteria bacterium HGW-Betaproteobacteria-12]
METFPNSSRRLMPILAALSVSLAMPAWADALPSLGEDSSPWQVDVTYENHTVRRERAGLAKFRNTLQAEFDKKVVDGWAIHGIVRGSWDGVYRMNKDEYGKDAGGSINMQSTTPGGFLTTPWGTGPVTNAVVAGLGLPGNRFVDTYPATNPNAGFRVLGDRWHDIDGGVAFAVPVRPCDEDKRGCRDFGGYGDQKQSELESPEFNDRADFIRELYARKTFALGDGKDLFVKIGKQQVVWGRTDLFRVLDVINPVDFSRNNIYDELSDIRIPMWIAQVEYRMGASESMQDRNLQFVWNFDKFRPNNLGQCGSPNSILDAGCFFRGMANLWDNGGTVSNFANVAPGVLLATNFGPGQIGLNEVDLPNWSLSNTQFGVKYEGVTQGGLSFSLNALTYRSQLPSLHGGKRATNSFTGEFRNAWPYLISFDMHYPRVNLLGGSMDFQVPDANAAVRVEAAFTDGEEFANTAKSELYSKNRVFRAVVGVDRPTFIPFISETSATLISGQLFYQHIFDHEWHRAAFGPVGMPDWENNFIGTLLIKAFLQNGTLSPQIIFAHDVKAHATVAAPQVEWNVTNDLKLTVGANYKIASGRDRWHFDDCRACNPFAPFTAPAGDADPFTAYSRGLGGMEPLGRFRAGPIGAAFKENDLFVKVNYKF